MSYKRIIVLYLAFFIFSIRPACVVAPQAGENQWRLLYRICVCFDELNSVIEDINDDLLSIGDLLCSKLIELDNNLFSMQENLVNVIDTFGSNTTSAIESISELLSSQLESIDTHCSCQHPLITFNDDCDVERQDFIALEFNYGVPADQTIVSTTPPGQVLETAGSVFLSTPDPGSSANVTTIRAIPTNSGDEVYALFSVAFSRPDDVTAHGIGLFDTDNGIGVGFPGPGASFSAFYRVDGIDTFIAQSSFNVDPLDGTGPSGFTLDTEAFNTFRLSYIWYGTNLIRYQVLNTNDEWITFHEISNVNSQTTAAFGNPYLPMSMGQINLGITTGTADELFTTAWRGGVIHSGEENAAIRTFAFNVTQPALVSGETYMFTLQNRATFGGETNKILVRLARVGGGNTFDSTTPVIIRYYKNSTLTGETFTDINTNNSVVEVDTTAATFTGGNLLWTLGGTFDFDYIPTDRIEFYLAPTESVTVTIEQLAGLVGASFYATAIWQELH